MELSKNFTLSFFEPIYTAEINSEITDALLFLHNKSKELELPDLQMIAANEHTEGSTRLMFTGHIDWINSFVKKIESEKIKISKNIKFGIYLGGLGSDPHHFEFEILKSIKKHKITFDKYIKESKGIIFISSIESKKEFKDFFEKIIS